MIDWSAVFDSAQPKKGASPAAVARFVAHLGAPLTRAEVARVNGAQRNPWLATQPEHAAWQPFDPGAWVMPADRPVPPSYRSFCRYSDGGTFQTGDRLFQMWGTGLREFLIGYSVPQYMPRAVPFAFNGGGVMYLFDMRDPPGAHGEYPILCAGAGCLDFDPHESPRVADSFPEVCRGRFNVERLRFGGVVLTADRWPTCADPKPMLDDCTDERKLRLFACACARRAWAAIPPGPFRDAVELAERFADAGRPLDADRKALKKRCEALQHTPAWNVAAAAATNCLSTSASGAAWNGPFAAASAEAALRGSTPEAARAAQADLLREIFGNPLRPVRVDPAWLSWHGRTVPQVADRIYRTNGFGDLPVLADALEDAGCTNADILSHLRDAREHVRGCWALDLLRAGPKN